MNLIDTLLAQGAPIDIAGMQNHLWIYRPLLRESEMQVFISQIEKRGLQIASTETTINMGRANHLIGETVENVVSKEEAEKRQLEYLHLLLKVFLERKAPVSFFGLTIDVSMFKDVNNLEAQGLPLGPNYQKRAMYYLILQMFYEEFLSQK